LLLLLVLLLVLLPVQTMHPIMDYCVTVLVLFSKANSFCSENSNRAVLLKKDDTSDQY
jgi:hypothetical protein